MDEVNSLQCPLALKGSVGQVVSLEAVVLCMEACEGSCDIVEI